MIDIIKAITSDPAPPSLTFLFSLLYFIGLAAVIGPTKYLIWLLLKDANHTYESGIFVALGYTAILIIISNLLFN